MAQRIGGSFSPPGREEARHPIKAAALLYTAPSWLLRGPIYMTFVIIVASIVYLSWARKDAIVTAPLKLQREAVTVQAVGGGMVTELQVEPNLPLRVGQPMVTVQEKVRAIASPEQEALDREIGGVQDQLQQMLQETGHRLSQLALDEINAEKGRTTTLLTVATRINGLRAQLEMAEAVREDLQRKLALARKRLATQTELYNSRDITILDFERAQELVNDLQSRLGTAEIEVQRTRLALETARQEQSELESRTDVAKIHAEIKQQELRRDEDGRRLRDRIRDLERRRDEANRLIQGVTYQDNRARYTATIDGLVTEVLVRKGQLIDAGTPLVTIVKDSAAVEAQVLVQNKDIGNLKHGQAVSIKYFAYPYQEYGIQSGVIASIATKPSGQPGRESLYVVTVALDRETIRDASGREKRLELGLEGIAEIKTGDKRWIELIFTPLSKFFASPEDF